MVRRPVVWTQDDWVTWTWRKFESVGVILVWRRTNISLRKLIPVEVGVLAHKQSLVVSRSEDPGLKLCLVSFEIGSCEKISFKLIGTWMNYNGSVMRYKSHSYKLDLKEAWLGPNLMKKFPSTIYFMLGLGYLLQLGCFSRIRPGCDS